MSTQFVVRRFPTAERLGGRGQARRQPEHVQQPIRIVGEQMPAIDIHGIERRSRPQAYLRQLERTREEPLSLHLPKHYARPVREGPRGQQ
jgi:hypothetical protein